MLLFRIFSIVFILQSYIIIYIEKAHYPFLIPHLFSFTFFLRSSLLRSKLSRRKSVQMVPSAQRM